MPTLEEIEQLAKRRGFFYPSDEIYGGLGGFYTYGHLGVLMKRKLEDIWRRHFLDEDNFYEIDPSLIMQSKVFEASGHTNFFVDPIAKCKTCHTVHRADHIVEENLKGKFEGMTPIELEEMIKKHKIRCSNCGGELEETGVLNLMFPLDIGSDMKGYLRPETAQGVYVNFSRQFELLRKRLPIGLAIIGKAFRNEISPRQLLLRMREFTQAELQIFFDPEKLSEHEDWENIKDYKLMLLPVTERKKQEVEMTCDNAVKKLKLPEFYVYYLAKVQKFYLDILQVPKNRFRFKEFDQEERAFYNNLQWDAEIKLHNLDDFKEVSGVHYRTDYDLKGHEKISKKAQEIFYDNKKFIPHVLELSFGIDRILFTLLDLAYSKDKERTFLKIPPAMAPITVSVFPLVNKEGLDKKAKKLFLMLKEEFSAFYDDDGSIGRRYARADEVGTVASITCDYQTLEDDSVTIRDRDTKKQIRIKITEITNVLNALLSGKSIEMLGKIVK